MAVFGASGIVGVCIVLALADDTSWLDLPLGEWNEPGVRIPTAPEGEEVPALRRRCPGLMRAPSRPEERALARAGWKLFGAAKRAGETRVLSGFVQADGMCRPSGQQAFVFVGDRFAGTLWPEPAHPRTDGAPMELAFVDEHTISVRFARYTEEDALCCPSSSRVVTFRVRRDPNGPVVVPVKMQDPTTAD